MIGVLKKSLIGWTFICCAVSLMGCGEPEKEMNPYFLIKTSSMIIIYGDFLEELDLKRAAYPYNIDENPAEYNEMVLHLIRMLSDEIILLSAAADKGVKVTDQELESSEKKFKKDYSEDSFEQILLKNAISYTFWKKRFKKNMIIDKLIDQELKKKIEIAPQDIVEFYKNHRIEAMQKSDKNDSALKTFENEEELVASLRLQKAQDHYDGWMQQLWNDYPVEINKKNLKTFLIYPEKSGGSESESEKEN